MTTQQHILACIDGSSVTESVCDYAVWYASRLALPVSLLNVIDVPVSARRDMSGSIGMNSRQHLLHELTQLDDHRAKVAHDYSEALTEDAKSYINSKSDVEVIVYRRPGKLLPAIEHFAEKNRAIVMGRRGEDHNNNRVNTGSQIETIARASSVPVLICSSSFKTPRSFMIAFDPSATAIKAIDTIAQSPLLQGMQAHIVMIGNSNDSSREDLASALEQLESAGFMASAHHIPGSNTVNKLLKFQEDYSVDMIVIGAYAGSKLRQLFLGSTTTEIIANTLSPIILVR